VAGAGGPVTDVPEAAEPSGFAGAGLHRVTEALAHARGHLRGDDTLGQFTRFVVVGGLSTLVYGLIFVAAQSLGDQVANLIGAVFSTMLANELHRRLTFHAGRQVTWFTAQWEGGGLAVVGLVATSLSLAGFHALFGDVPALAQIALVTTVTGVIGSIRFVALRAWVFSTGSVRPG
jgi:putative flippase GtrA